MERDKWVWMPHAGHFILGHKCQFRLCTYVGKYIVSTVGELPDSDNTEKMRTIGFDRLYETMVFKSKKSGNKCCPYEMKDADNLDFGSYNDADSARKGHLNMCAKWAREGR